MAERTSSWQGERWEIAPEDVAFPDMLCDMDKVPSVIRGIGDASVLKTPCLSVIGARRATPYGLAVASMAGRIAAESGITLVSGGAMGCDAAALRGALDAGGRAVVVSGVGPDKVYPASSTDVFERAPQSGGAVIALAPWGSNVHRFAFLERNVVIAALSRATLVSEAGQRSGTLSTALAAAQMGRQVYAVPGSIYSPESIGANGLIRDGASIVTSEADLEMLISQDYGVLRLVQDEVATPRNRVMSALVASPMRPDDLANHLGISPLEMLRILADCEVGGEVKRLPDGRYAASQEALLGRGRMGGQNKD